VPFLVLRIPSEPGNAWFFGPSRPQILKGGASILAFIPLGIMAGFFFHQPPWWQKAIKSMKGFVSSKNNLSWLLTLLCLILILIPLLTVAVQNLALYPILEKFGAMFLWVVLIIITLGVILFLYFSEIIIEKRLFLLVTGIFAATHVLNQYYAILLKWVETPRKAYWPLLAQAFLHGKLYFLNTPSTTHDLILYLGHWYLPPPPLPAIIMMPYLRLVGLGNVNTVFFSIFFASINSVLLFLILDLLRKKEWIKLSQTGLFWLVGLFAFGTPHFYMGIIGMEWQISKVLAVTFLALSIFCVLKAWSPWLVGLCLGLAMASRPNLFVIWPFLLAIAVQIVQDCKKRKLEWKWLVKWISVSAIPVVVVVIGLLLYNYFRFGNPLDFGYININGSTLITENVRKYGIFNIHFIPINLFVMFL
jgi:hypothetical protein